MDHNAEVAAFIESHISYAVSEAAAYYEGVKGNELTIAISGLALALFKFVAVKTQNIDLADSAETDFRQRVALLLSPVGAVN